MSLYGEEDQSNKQIGKIKRKAARRELLHPGMRAILLAAIGVALFAAFSFFTFPITLPFLAGWIGQALLNAVFTTSSVYLMAISYGVVNDTIGSVGNVEYFSEGHKPKHKKWWLVDSDGIIANAFAWGIGAFHGFYLFEKISVPVLAAGIFGVSVFITSMLGFPFATFMLPILGAGIAVGIVAAELYARYKVPSTSELYPTKADVNYWRNNYRNKFGFVVMPLVAIPGVVAMTTITALKVTLTALTVGSAVLMPVVFAAVMAVVLLIGCVYLLYLNSARKAGKPMETDNTQRLELGDDEDEDDEEEEDDTLGDTLQDSPQKIARGLPETGRDNGQERTSAPPTPSFSPVKPRYKLNQDARRAEAMEELSSDEADPLVVPTVQQQKAF